MRDSDQPPPTWSPTFIRRRIDTQIESSTQPTFVVTDAGNAYVKWPANTQGPAALSSELIGTRLAEWMGLETFSYAVFEAAPADAFADSADETSVPVFTTQEVLGEPWNGSSRLLTKIENPEDISWLVVFDTFACNYDRYCIRTVRGEAHPHANTRNVFLGSNAAEGRFRLRVYDHTLCEYALIDSPSRAGQRDEDRKDKIEDPAVYGLFPAFKPHLDREQVRQAAAKLASLETQAIATIVDSVPKAWIQHDESPDRWKEFIEKRAAFVAETIETRIFRQLELPYDQ